jgi:hypothetical protein
MTHPKAQITANNYVSYFCSRYYPWFLDLGYPRLDVIEYTDGEWGIIQMESGPIIPAETKWRLVLQGIRNVEISWSFIRKYVHMIDNQRREYWDREAARSRAVEAEYEAKEDAAVDRAERVFQAIKRNDGLMNRIARNGLSEMDPRRLARHVPKHQL